MAKVTPRLIDLTVSAVNRADEVNKISVTSGNADDAFLSFAKARLGGARGYTIKMTVAQDHASGTLWDLIWTGAGTQVAIKYAPYGNTMATAAQPHYTATAVVAEPDGDLMGGESTTSVRAVSVVEVEWDLTDRPVKVIA